MKWFRSNVRHGSWLALAALVVQLALSFGHFHAVAGQAAPTVASDQGQPASNPDSDRHPNDACAICAVIALANTGLSATPPLLLLPHAVAFLYQASDAGLVHPNSARVAFQPRAPPAS